jgi:hypothetical protein
MLWCISTTRLSSAIVNDEDGSWIATFKDITTAESVVAAHNCFQQRNQTTESTEGNNILGAVMASTWTRGLPKFS